MTLYFLSIFYNYDHCEHVGVFSTKERAIVALDDWLAVHPWRTDRGYNAEVRAFEINTPIINAIADLVYFRNVIDGGMEASP